jgi:hypothetical protein
MRDHVREPYRDDTPDWRKDSRGVAQSICQRQERGGPQYNAKGLTVAEEHWFDSLNVALTGDGSRRGIFRAAGGLVAGLLLGDSSASAANGKKRHRKRKKHIDKPKPRPRPKPPQSCSEGVCAERWAGKQGEIDYCEFICLQCAMDTPRDFCVDEGDPNSPVARCCQVGSPDCCNGKCTNLEDDKKNCATCGNACADGQACRGGECGCADPCPHGMLCLDESGSACGASSNCRCWCGPNFKYCPNINGGVCASQNAVC